MPHLSAPKAFSLLLVRFKLFHRELILALVGSWETPILGLYIGRTWNIGRSDIWFVFLLWLPLVLPCYLGSHTCMVNHCNNGLGSLSLHVLTNLFRESCTILLLLLYKINLFINHCFEICIPKYFHISLYGFIF